MRCCSTCRYWSDLIAQKPSGSMHVEALCLCHAGPQHQQYTRGTDWCAHWALNDLGQVDEPGRDPRRYRVREQRPAEVREQRIAIAQVTAPRPQAAIPQVLQNIADKAQAGGYAMVTHTFLHAAFGPVNAHAKASLWALERGLSLKRAPLGFRVVKRDA